GVVALAIAAERPAAELGSGAVRLLVALDLEALTVVGGRDAACVGEGPTADLCRRRALGRAARDLVRVRRAAAVAAAAVRIAAVAAAAVARAPARRSAGGGTSGR